LVINSIKTYVKGVINWNTSQSESGLCEKSSPGELELLGKQQSNLELDRRCHGYMYNFNLVLTKEQKG
jgi:hypothetical protein